MPLVSGFLFPFYHKIIENEKAYFFARKKQLNFFLKIYFYITFPPKYQEHLFFSPKLLSYKPLSTLTAAL